MKSTIYAIINPDTAMPFYVGQTNNFTKRQYQHLYRSHNKKVNELINSILQAGKEVNFIVLDECEPENADLLEAFYINHYFNIGCDLCNLGPGRPKKGQTTLINFRIPVTDYERLKKVPKLTTLFKEWIKSIM